MVETTANRGIIHQQCLKQAHAQFQVRAGTTQQHGENQEKSQAGLANKQSVRHSGPGQLWPSPSSMTWAETRIISRPFPPLRPFFSTGVPRLVLYKAKPSRAPAIAMATTKLQERTKKKATRSTVKIQIPLDFPVPAQLPKESNHDGFSSWGRVNSRAVPIHTASSRLHNTIQQQTRTPERPIISAAAVLVLPPPPLLQYS